jgi:lysophospholipase L1-like esterase
VDPPDVDRTPGQQDLPAMTTHPNTRYVALGDSQTEGIGDGDEARGYRGWADRLAEILAEDNPEFAYANLAVRGRVTAQVKAEQLGPALSLKPNLATVTAGMNDLMRPGFDAARVVADVDEMFARLTASVEGSGPSRWERPYPLARVRTCPSALRCGAPTAC